MLHSNVYYAYILYLSLNYIQYVYIIHKSATQSPPSPQILMDISRTIQTVCFSYTPIVRPLRLVHLSKHFLICFTGNHYCFAKLL